MPYIVERLQHFGDYLALKYRFDTSEVWKYVVLDKRLHEWPHSSRSESTRSEEGIKLGPDTYDPMLPVGQFLNWEDAAFFARMKWNEDRVNAL